MSYLVLFPYLLSCSSIFLCFLSRSSPRRRSRESKTASSSQSLECVRRERISLHTWGGGLGDTWGDSITAYIEVDGLGYLQSEPTVAVDVDPVGQGGGGTGMAQLGIKPGHLSEALPAETTEETQTATEQERVVDCCNPAGSPHPADLSVSLKHSPSQCC